ncbi:uncharacterized protein METZ01_LOCUS489786, partial [marine metagenome]
MKRLLLFLLLHLVISPISAMQYKVNLYGSGTAAGKSNIGVGCIILDHLTILDSGFIRLSFRGNMFQQCDSIIYHVETVPPEQIRGVERIDKSGIYRIPFSIDVTPITTQI